jgi:pimeloyl-ACP methyl ester carboxylesterase
MADGRLHVMEAGPKTGMPVVLLHGFGGHAASWSAVLGYLPTDIRVLAFDLPGHAGSLDYPGFGSPRTAALAVLAELRSRGIQKAHIAGHSMGGAAAILLAMEEPDVAGSLTLAAPGGFGPEMDGEALRSMAEARSAGELSRAFAAMMAPQAEPDPVMIQDLFRVHDRPGQREALRQTLARISRGQGQGELPLGTLVKGCFPVKLLWGTRDPILPYAQSANAPDWFDRIELPGEGHMLLDEAPEAVAAAIAGQVRDLPQTI